MGLFDVLSQVLGDGDGETDGDGSDDASGAAPLADLTVADFRDRAETLVDQSPIDLDYSVASLARLDEAVAGQGGTSEARVACGGYLGEVLVREFDAEWTAGEEWAVAVDVGDDVWTVHVLDAAERLLSGDQVFGDIGSRVERAATETDPSAGTDERADDRAESAATAAETADSTVGETDRAEREDDEAEQTTTDERTQRSEAPADSDATEARPGEDGDRDGRPVAAETTPSAGDDEEDGPAADDREGPDERDGASDPAVDAGQGSGTGDADGGTGPAAEDRATRPERADEEGGPTDGADRAVASVDDGASDADSEDRSAADGTPDDETGDSNGSEVPDDGDRDGTGATAGADEPDGADAPVETDPERVAPKGETGPPDDAAPSDDGGTGPVDDRPDADAREEAVASTADGTDAHEKAEDDEAADDADDGEDADVPETTVDGDASAGVRAADETPPATVEGPDPDPDPDSDDGTGQSPSVAADEDTSSDAATDERSDDEPDDAATDDGEQATATGGVTADESGTGDDTAEDDGPEATDVGEELTTDEREACAADTEPDDDESAGTPSADVAPGPTPPDETGSDSEPPSGSDSGPPPSRASDTAESDGEAADVPADDGTPPDGAGDGSAVPGPSSDTHEGAIADPPGDADATAGQGRTADGTAGVSPADGATEAGASDTERGDGPETADGEDGDPVEASDETDGDVPAGPDAGRAVPGSEGIGDPDTPEAVAASLSADWPDYELDRTPPSLGRLDALLEAVRGAPDRRDCPPVGRLAAYYGAVLVDAVDGAWRRYGDGGVVVSLGDAGESLVVDCEHVAEACLSGGSFAVHFAAVADWIDADVSVPEEDAVGAVHTGAYHARFAARDSPAAITALTEAADAFAAAWPSYDLDYSPVSLARLDDLAGAELAGHALVGVHVGAVDPEGTGLPLVTRRVTGAAAYFAALLVRHADAVWRPAEGASVRVSGREGGRTVDAVEVATARIRDGTAFVDSYETLCADLGVDAPPAAGTDG